MAENVNDNDNDSSWCPPGDDGSGIKLKKKLIRALQALDMKKPSKIQKQGIRACLDGKSFYFEAPAGTGKTIAMSIAILQRIEPEEETCEALILAPTREKASKTYQVIKNLSEFMSITCHAAIGGMGIVDNIHTFRMTKAAHIVVGTPGRILHLMEGNSKIGFRWDQVKMLVMLQSDYLLETNMKQDVCKIFKHLSNPQVIPCCEMLTPLLEQEAERVLGNRRPGPYAVISSKKGRGLRHIKQFCVKVPSPKKAGAGGGDKEDLKVGIFMDLYPKLPITSKTIIFCRSQKSISKLTKSLQVKGHTFATFHDAMKKEVVETVLKEFQNGLFLVLIATDVLFANCDMDMKGISLIINYDLPIMYEAYIKRMGSPDPFRRKRVIINFITSKDHGIVEEIEECLNIQMPEVPVNVADIFYAQ